MIITFQVTNAGTNLVTCHDILVTELTHSQAMMDDGESEERDKAHFN